MKEIDLTLVVCSIYTYPQDGQLELTYCENDSQHGGGSGDGGGGEDDDYGEDDGDDRHFLVLS